MWALVLTSLYLSPCSANHWHYVVVPLSNLDELFIHVASDGVGLQVERLLFWSSVPLTYVEKKIGDGLDIHVEHLATYSFAHLRGVLDKSFSVSYIKVSPPNQFSLPTINGN